MRNYTLLTSKKLKDAKECVLVLGYSIRVTAQVLGIPNSTLARNLKKEGVRSTKCLK